MGRGRETHERLELQRTQRIHLEIYVIKVGDNLTSGYPTGKIKASRPSGF